jgi:DeoR/GlpR family transcriptional regulator of sugar metabolism
MAFVGPQALLSIEPLSAEVAIIGCDGLSAERGLTTPHQLVASIGTNMVHRARRKIVVADSSKVGRHGLTRIASINEVDTLVTDTDVDQGQVKELRRLGVEVIIV